MIAAGASLHALRGESAVDGNSASGRILYISAGSLRSVRPDGTGDRLLVPLRRDVGADRDGDCLNDRTEVADVCFDVGSAAWSPDRGRVAYAVTHRGLFVARADGRRPRRLVVGYMRTLDWSPTGPDIAYDWEALEPDGQAPRIYVVRTDRATRPRLVASAPFFAWYPRWSPDGRWIVYRRDEESSPSSLWVVRADGGMRRRVARVSGSSFGSAEWSPDSRRLVYHDAGTIFVVGRNGSGLRRVIRTGDDLDAHPHFAPDGGAIAYRERRFCGPDDVGEEVWEVQVAVLNLATGARRWVAPPCERHGDFRWSPDGEELLLDVYNPQDAGLFVVPLDGSRRVKVADPARIEDW